MNFGLGGDFNLKLLRDDITLNENAIKSMLS